MAQDLRSRRITEGTGRAGARAMLRAVGFTDADFAKPLVGVANGYSNVTPCTVGIGALAERAEAALKSAGAMPQVFGTITVSDGIAMGTEAMKYSLVSREVIADSIETACNGQAMDGVLALGACDKNMPGAMIAIARMDIPALFVYGGTIKAGRLGGRDLTIGNVYEAMGAHAAGKIDEKELGEIERSACPGAGACGGMFTANTMSSAIEAMGMSLPGSSTMAAEDAEKAESAAESARVLARAVRQGLSAAADPHAPGLRERDRGGDGGGGLDERGAPPPGHRPRRGGAPRDRRLRDDPGAGPRALRPQALRPLTSPPTSTGRGGFPR